MEKIYPFEGEGKWYKGNLHCHSTVSDGKLTPDEVVKIYRDNGWNFLAFTEHETYSDYGKKYDTAEFITIPGTEASNNNFDEYNYNHILGLSKGNKDSLAVNRESFSNGDIVESEPWLGIKSMQSTIDTLNNKNNISIICHPVWSRSNINILNSLSGYTAVEIYNYGCQIESNTGLSTAYWDYLLREGKKVFGIATDDAHHILKDECGGFIVVKADELTPEKIINSIAEGRFYSSSGPEIFNYYVEDGYVHVECSDVKHIHVMAYGHMSWGMSYHAQSGQYINSVDHKMNGYEQYIRVECEDEHGETAWSNPIFLQANRA